MLHRDLDRCVTGERHFGSQELVEHDPRRVEVGGLVDGSTPRLLGREVLRGADDRALFRHLAGAGPSDPEIGHLHDPFRVDDDVVRLDVAVDDAVAMRVAKPGEDLARVRDGDGNGAGSPAANELLERPALDVLHHDEVRAVRLPPVEDRDDVRVGEAGRMRCLAAEALDELLVVRVALVQDLDGHAATQLLILGEVHVGHAAAPELPRDPVSTGEECAAEGVLSRHDFLEVRDSPSRAGLPA